MSVASGRSVDSTRVPGELKRLGAKTRGGGRGRRRGTRERHVADRPSAPGQAAQQFDQPGNMARDFQRLVDSSRGKSKE